MQNGVLENHQTTTADTTTPLLQGSDEQATYTTSAKVAVNGKEVDVQDSEDTFVISQSDDHPAKRRKTTNESPARSVRRVSPPWRQAGVEGPTSFVEDGKRKSSRVSTLSRLQSPASSAHSQDASRQASPAGMLKTPRAASHTNGSTRTPSRLSRPLLDGTDDMEDEITLENGPQIRTSPRSNKAVSIPREKRKYVRRSLVTSNEQPPAEPASAASGRNRRMSQKFLESELYQSPKKSSHSGPGRRKSSVAIREDKNGHGHTAEGEVQATPVKRKVGRPRRHPLPSPEREEPPKRAVTPLKEPPVTTKLHIASAPVWPSLDDWLYQNYAADDLLNVRMSDARVRSQAYNMGKVVDAAKRGGITSSPDPNTNTAESQREPPRQYARQDHMLSHAVNFQRLLNRERRQHIATAKRIAQAAQARWLELQPKSDEALAKEAEARQAAAILAIAKQCIADIDMKWQIIRAEVDKYRLAKWEQEQETLGKEALNKVLEQSSNLLDARRRRDSIGSDADDDLDDSDDESEESDEESSDEENMSGSSSEQDSDEDEGKIDDREDEELSIAELRRKYSTAAATTPLKTDSPKRDQTPDFNDDEVSIKQTRSNRLNSFDEDPPMDNAELQDSDGDDESVDMDDDMGSSDEGTPEDSDEDDSDEEDEDESEGDDGLGLLGFFSSADELKDERRNSVNGLMSRTSITNEDEEEEEIEEVSMIPDPEQFHASQETNGKLQVSDMTKQSADDCDNRTKSNGTNALGLPPDDSHRENHTSTDFKEGSIEKEAVPKEIKHDEVAEAEPAIEEVSHQGDIEMTTEEQQQNDATEDVPISEEAAESQALVTQDRDNSAEAPVSKTAVPSLLRATLREYQHFGLDWLAGLYASSSNGILADEMGLGKTLQTISLLAHLAVHHHVWGPHLIVVPTSVMLNWEVEFKKFLPGFKVLTYYGSQDERRLKRKGWLDDDKWNVVITSYQLVLHDQVSFKKRAWHYLVLDEAHNIKNFKSQKWQALLTFRTHSRLLLTGTPLQNNLTELWSLMFFLMPADSTETGISGFADLAAFTNWFKKPVDQILEQGQTQLDTEAQELINRLHEILRPYLLRRLKADVEKQMPGKYEHVVYCKLSKRQRYLYDGFMSRSSTRETLASGSYISIVGCLMQLRKVCNHPDLFETRQIVTSYVMPRSVVGEYRYTEKLIRKRLFASSWDSRCDFGTCNFILNGQDLFSPASSYQAKRVKAWQGIRSLGRELGSLKLISENNCATVDGSIGAMYEQGRVDVSQHLDDLGFLHCMRSQQNPPMTRATADYLRSAFDLSRLGYKKRPDAASEVLDWMTRRSDLLPASALSISDRATRLRDVVEQFACITPAAITHDTLPLTLTNDGLKVGSQLSRRKAMDPFHQAQMKLSIAFPDKRLLQYDCGKLQQLDKLLRTLQAGGHRALIFTQMTKVLDILEQFLNIHGHRYLRLDGSTKIEQRQILTDRFNNDTRILAFILSSRSGGLGINLTGADTVIFYDLDWNPAMDKQCQDRCHRIGQTRDVHIYRFVSEYTIEANILRKANQKRMLDDVVINGGAFTTDFFNKDKSGAAASGADDEKDEMDADANAAMDRVLGGLTQKSTKLLQQAEDREDVVAAQTAEKEVNQADDVDFGGDAVRANAASINTAGRPGESVSKGDVVEADELSGALLSERDGEFISGITMPRTEMSLEIFKDVDIVGVDRYMVEYLEWEGHDKPLVVPVDKSKKSKRARDIGRKR